MYCIPLCVNKKCGVLCVNKKQLSVKVCQQKPSIALETMSKVKFDKLLNIVFIKSVGTEEPNEALL